jgi:hypothetical protein
MIIEEPWNDERLQRIISNLLERSRNRGVDWQRFQTSGRSVPGRDRRSSVPTRPDAYAYSTPTATVVVGSSDGDGQNPFYLQILDSDGTTVESFAVPFSDLRPSTGEEPPEIPRDALDMEDRVRDLYMLARRGALRTDSVLDDLAAELDI